ncbi:MAG: hypothetical protein ACHQJ5_05195 [Vicinamibacteria bacterium]|jgi:hypothetical protein
MAPEQPAVAGWLRVLLGLFGFVAAIVALWFGILGWFFVSLSGAVGAVWYAGSALTSAAAAVTAIATVITGERIWLRRTGWATALLVLWIVGGGLIVAATD